MLLLLAGCADSISLIVNIPDTPGSTGSPEMVTQQRGIPDLDAVVLSGAGVLFITQGDQAELRIRSEQGVLDHLSTEVTGGELRIQFSEGFTLDHPLVLDCFLTVADLEKIHLRGLWKVDVSGLYGSRLSVRIDGLGEANLSSIDLPSLDVESSGPGRISASGRATSLSVVLNGVGSYTGGALLSQEANVSIRSTGSATVAVRNQLDAEISGAGPVYYYGDPAVTRTGNGSGVVQRIGG